MIWSTSDATSRHDYDPAKAKQLLAEAGYPNGLKKVLNPSGAATLPFAEALQASARAAGLDLNLVPGEFTPAFRERKYEVCSAIRVPGCRILSRLPPSTPIIPTTATRRVSAAIISGEPG